MENRAPYFSRTRVLLTTLGLFGLLLRAPLPAAPVAGFGIPGTLTVSASATDNVAGNLTTSSGASVTVANPTVSILAPLNGAKLTNLTKVKVHATSSIGLSFIQIYSDSSLIGTVSLTTNPWLDLVSTVNWQTQGLANGHHSLYAVATDIFGNSSTSAPVAVKK